FGVGCRPRESRARVGVLRAAMNLRTSRAAILMAFRIRMCGRAPSAQSPYTVAVQSPNWRAASLMFSRHSVFDCERDVRLRRNTGRTKSVLMGAKTSDVGDPLTDRS